MSICVAMWVSWPAARRLTARTGLSFFPQKDPSAYTSLTESFTIANRQSRPRILTSSSFLIY
jgi:hypothetical protein